MKHSLKITLLIILIFIAAQLVGLVTINRHIGVTITEEGETLIEHPATVIGEPMHMEEQQKKFSFAYILLGVLLGTVLLFVLVRFRVKSVWKYWFLLAVIITLSVSFGVYVDKKIAVIIALILGFWKIYRPNPVVHNITEIFVYTGIAIIFIPILNLTSVVILLVLISVYDMIAVWKSKHMIKLAKFQSSSKVFAGLFIPYIPYKRPESQAMTPEKAKALKKELREMGILDKVMIKKEVKNAVLGGGDIAFPLLFSATVMEYLIKLGFEKSSALGLTGITTATTTIALAVLLLTAKEDRFYPAMPFISLGCLLGFAVIWLGWIM